nr:glutamate synthase large subunit [Ktedonobacterales bacterium]
APNAASHLALGMCFLPQEPTAQAQIRQVLAEVITRRGMRVLGWRVVPIDRAVLSQRAQRDCPQIEQVVIEITDDDVANDATEARLYLARREMEQRLVAHVPAGFAIPSLSARTVVYKGLLTAAQLPQFYSDLLDPRYVTAFAVFHQRYSTNTFPSWRLAQPFHYLAHNGEINTVQGNRMWMSAREAAVLAHHWPTEVNWLRPVIQPGGSDSTSLDNVVELLRHTGSGLLKALAVLAPEAWENQTDLAPALHAFYAAHATMQEPWDGPAALVYSDGQVVGAKLDRNGLRPLRYSVTADGLLVVASEVGVLDDERHTMVTKGRLGPGQMIAVDLQRGILLTDEEIKATLALQAPYADWVQQHQLAIAPDPPAALPLPPSDLLPLQARFGYTHEDVELIIRPLAAGNGEAVWSMGDDTPLAVLSQQPRPLAAYFKQRFAQVTNPPIDALRERSVMSLTAYLGPRGSAFTGAEPTQMLLTLPTPQLDDELLGHVLRAAQQHHLQSALIACDYIADPTDTDALALASALEMIGARTVAAAHAGARVVLLSDRDVADGHTPVPMLLALATAHQALLRAEVRTQVGLIAQTGGVWDTHQAALLIGYGANAIHPYLALATASAFAGTRGLEAFTPAQAQRYYRSALEKGLLKIIARMGISVLENYHGAQLFEALGLDADLIASYFPGTPSSLGGLGLREIHARVCQQQEDATRLAEEDDDQRRHLADRGYVRFRRNGEYHAANPAIVKALQRVAQSGTPEDYAHYAALVHQRPATAIRDQLIWRAGTAIPIEEVEPAAAIVRRFVSSAMSVGSLSPEAHLTLTLGMNQLGARSNTGEGGEDPTHFTMQRDGVAMNNRVKQIASGRFGVTAAYVAHAEEIEIKMAQGSKPGEGGQIPASKVTEHIARLRHTSPGIPLISPPPHHDIYSIEDLAQLIFDLKQVNPRAAVGVKLVATRGVGPIAAGVAKGHADYILISGHDGGTGSSPLSAIKHVGIPWEMGLAEAQQVLRLNGLRVRVRLRVDGGLKTGRDIIIAALLGADEYGMGTAALIALGCDMARQCHLDTCPAGIATQRADLRQKFTGTPAHVAHFLLALAEDVRAILASLGFRSLDEIIGRADLLEVLPTAHPAHLNLTALLANGPDATPRRHTLNADRVLVPSQPSPEARLLDDALPLLERGHGVLVQSHITNRDRTVGGSLAGEIARRWGDAGLPSGSITSHFTGSAGQSFGAFCLPGMRLLLTGDANDYVAKGMTGGEIVITPPHQRDFVPHTQVIVGNTVLYGATGGLLMVQGRAGERFAVRNSGAVAIAEGVGDHGCEYMTGGVVIILGPTGRNFGAGMSGGVAYVFDPAAVFPDRFNGEAMHLERGLSPEDVRDIGALLRHYVAMTGSQFAAGLLDDWPTASANFWRIISGASVGQQPPLGAAIAQLSAIPLSASA